MPSLSALEEILILSTVLQLQALADIGACMAVHYIQQYPDTHTMGLVHQVLQVLRIAVPVCRGEEVRHLIAE